MTRNTDVNLSASRILIRAIITSTVWDKQERDEQSDAYIHILGMWRHMRLVYRTWHCVTLATRSISARTWEFWPCFTQSPNASTVSSVSLELSRNLELPSLTHCKKRKQNQSKIKRHTISTTAFLHMIQFKATERLSYLACQYFHSDNFLLSTTCYKLINNFCTVLKLSMRNSFIYFSNNGHKQP